jgi:hypothetical protein
MGFWQEKLTAESWPPLFSNVDAGGAHWLAKKSWR